MKSTQAILTASVLALALAAPASAAVRTFPGALCNPADVSVTDSTNMRINQFGPYAKSTSALNVVCGANIDGTVTQLQINAYDRSDTATLTCTLRLLDTTGNQVFSSQKDTGPASTKSSIPFLITFPVTGGVTAATAIVECALPGLSGGNASHLASYQFTL